LVFANRLSECTACAVWGQRGKTIIVKQMGAGECGMDGGDVSRTLPTHWRLGLMAISRDDGVFRELMLLVLYLRRVPFIVDQQYPTSITAR